MKKIALTVATLYTLALAYFSLTPVPKEASTLVNISDIVQHFAAYLILSLLWYLYWRKIAYSSILALTVGLLTELAQKTVPYRVFSLADLAANTAGVTVFAAGVYLTSILLKRSQLNLSKHTILHED